MNLSDQTIRDICDQFGTPLYIYDGEHLEERYFDFKNRLHPAIDIFYSLKANSNVTIAHLYQKWGANIEVASLGELRIALEAGFSPEQILFTGPGKSMRELETAIQQNIYCLNIESLTELQHVAMIAKEKNQQVNISVRVNPDSDINSTSLKMGGVPRQFGIDESQLERFFAMLAAYPHLHFKGIHIYSGTQNLNLTSILHSFQYTIGLAHKVLEVYKHTCEFINLGGGLGVPYFQHESPLDMDELCKRLNEMVEQALQTFPHTRFIIESGRYLTATSGGYVSRVLYTKISKNEKFVIVDGGMHHHAGATFRGRALRNNFPMKVIKQHQAPKSVFEKVNVTGTLCTPDDVLGKNVELEQTEAGDIICVLHSGAYGMTFSPVLFLGHNTPAEILVYNDQFHVIRDRGTEEDLLRNQRFIHLETKGE